MGRSGLTIIAVVALVLAGSTGASAAPFAYIPNSGSSSISVIDTSTYGVVTTVPVGNGPSGVAVTPDGAFAYVANSASNTVSVIDTATNTVVGAPVGVGVFPSGVAVTPDGAYVYVSNAGSNTVSVIATATNMVVGTPVGVGTSPYNVVVTPDGSRAYVANAGDSTVSVIDTTRNTVVATVLGLGGFPNGEAVTPDGSRVYVANQTTNNVSVIDANPTSPTYNTVTATVGVGSGPVLVAVSPDGSRVYVANCCFSNNVSVIDANPTSPTYNTVIATVPVGRTPTGVAVTPDGSSVYVTNYFDGTVSVIAVATNMVVKTIGVGVLPVSHGIFIGPPRPFAAFGVKVDINLVSSSFDVNSTLKLASGGSINPLTDWVTFRLGGFAITIPGGSFQLRGNGKHYVFDGTINGVALSANLTPLGGGNYSFKLEGAGASSLPTLTPVAVGLTIGSNGSSVSANVSFQ